MTDQPHNWQTQLRRQKNLSKRRTAPIDLRAKQISERLAYYKSALVAAKSMNDAAKTKELIGELFKLRAKQYEIWFEQKNASTGRPTPNQIKLALKEYYRDCARLGLSLTV